MALAVMAGLMLGGLVGLLVGLSASPLVGQVMGLLTTVGVAFLALRASTDTQPNDAPSRGGTTGFAPARLAALVAFCLACGATALTGLYLRTHGVLSPSAQDIKQELLALGMAEDDAIQLVVARFYRTGGGGESGTADPSDSVLFGTKGEDPSLTLGPDHRPEEYDRSSLEALWRSQGGRHAAFVAAMADLDLDEETFLAACGRFHRHHFTDQETP